MNSNRSLRRYAFFIFITCTAILLAACAGTAAPLPDDNAEPTTGSINGWIWHDECVSGMDGQPPLTETPAGCVQGDSVIGQYHANGVMDPQEKPIPGVTIRLGEGACPSTGLAEMVSIESDLSYSFTGLEAGTYCVSIDPTEQANQEALLPGIWTHPSIQDGLVGTTVAIGAGENKFDVNFGWDHQFKPQPPPTGDEASALRDIPVANVSVEVGVGSPIPVEAFVSGSWPDLCAQLAEVEQRVEGSTIDISLKASAAEPDCPPDYVVLPFRIALPLNMVEMPGGTYTIAVNGVETSFDWTSAGEAQAPGAAQAGELQPIPVEDVRVEIGVGSPIPVDVLVSGTWPGLCSQVARIEQRITDTQIDISLLASPDTPGCPPDVVGLPFRIALPLNMVEMELGAYTVRVNGVGAAFEWDAQPGVIDQEPHGDQGAATLAFIGQDGNVWVLGAPGEDPRQVTQDAVSSELGGAQQDEVVQYYFPALSSDGRLVAYRRDVGTPVESGLNYQFGLWVTDLTTGESRQVLDRISAGFAWKPGTHLLVYALGVEGSYFTTRGGIDQALANGIWSVDLDEAVLEPAELVRPERGYTLAAPTWSPDGRFLSFDEVHLYEGRGMFAYYDFESQEYVSWEEAIGQYAWSPDGKQVAYDRLTYTPIGEERIFVRERLGETERQLSPDFDQGYAFYPAFSPQGDRIAYLAGLGGPDSLDYTLFVQSLSGGEPRELGTFEGVWSLDWTPDGRSLVFSAGEYPEWQVYRVNVEDGEVAVLSEGKDPVLPAP